ncbi:MAG: transporter substrate-binding domain-containing protein [Phycisphaerales bacterium]
MHTPPTAPTTAAARAPRRRAESGLRLAALLALVCALAASVRGAHAAESAPAARAARAGEDPAAQQAAEVRSKAERQQISGDLAPIGGDTVLRVGVCDMPPWSIAPNQGEEEWTGIAVQLWKRVAQNLQLRYEVRSYSFTELQEALARKEIDIAATAINIEPENLTRFTLTPAFEQSGLSIATREREPLTMLAVIARLGEPEILRWMAAILVMILLFSAMLWMTERKRNPPFEGPMWRGMLEGIWLSLVTLTTVGYGDRVPVTSAGRFVASIWMLLGFIVLTVSAAVVTSVLTVQRLQPLVSDPGDLLRSRVGVVDGTLGADFIAKTEIPQVRTYPTYEAAVTALEARELDAVVGSTVVLGYLTDRSHDRDLVVLPRPLERTYVAMGMRFDLDPAIEKRIELELVRATHDRPYRAYRDAVLGAANATWGDDLPKKKRSTP